VARPADDSREMAGDASTRMARGPQRALRRVALGGKPYRAGGLVPMTPIPRRW